MPTDAHVTFQLPSGHEVVLRPGDFIGRLRTAALRIDDPRISEAHALISLRDGEMKLLALRGAIAIDRQRVSDVTLYPGLSLRLARDWMLTVVELGMPTEAIGVVLDGQPAVPLMGNAASIRWAPVAKLSSRFEPDADAHVWSDGVGWRLGLGEDSVVLEPGSSHTLGEHRVDVVTIPLTTAGLDATSMRGRLHPPLRVVASYDSVVLHRDGLDAVVLSGIQARIVCELIAFGGPTGWEVVAREIWKDVERHTLRRRWDVNLGRLRARLKAEDLRPDLLNSDGTGNIELILLPDDVVEDRM